MRFVFSNDQNDLLLEKRGISFYQIIEAIAENGILRRVKHSNIEKYPEEWMMIVEYDHYTYCVPYIVDRDTWFLKTVYPNRKYLHLLTLKETENE